jgi:MmyB-like transcription regulator ligand binding domain
MSGFTPNSSCATITPTGAAPPEQLDPAVADLVQRLEPFPTLVKGRRWDVLTANPAARELFADWAAGTPGEHNLVRWMFTTDQAREVYLEWEPEARAMLGRFRLSAARYPDDPDVRSLIAELQRDSEHVRDWWPRHDVAAIGGSGSKKLRHPRLGPSSTPTWSSRSPITRTRPWSPTP